MGVACCCGCGYAGCGAGHLAAQASRLAGACWAGASGLADEGHARFEAAWAQEKKDLNLEIAELVADLDKVSAGKDAAVTELTARITALETTLPRRGSSWNRRGRPGRRPPGK